MPLPAEVRRIHNPPPVARPVGAGAPRRLLIADLATSEPDRARRRDHCAPDPARPPHVPAIVDVHELPPVGRPRRRDRVIPLAVVVPRQAAGAILAHAPCRARAPVAHVGHEQVKPLLEHRRDERNAPPVRRPSRLHVHRAVAHQRTRRTRRQLEHAQLDRIVMVRRVDNKASVRRPIRLVVVSRPVRQLRRRIGADALPPERPLHRVHQLTPVRRPCRRARPARHLRDVQLPPVIRMRHVDLLEHRLPLCRDHCRHDEQHERDDALHHGTGCPSVATALTN